MKNNNKLPQAPLPEYAYIPINDLTGEPVSDGMRDNIVRDILARIDTFVKCDQRR